MRKLSFTVFLLLSGLGHCFGQDGTSKSRAAGLTVSFPWANMYAYRDYEKNIAAQKAGFVGLGAALFYRSSVHKFSLNAGAVADAIAPVGPIDYGREGTRTTIGALYTELLYHRPIVSYRLDNRRFEKFGLNIVAGTNLTHYRFSRISYVDSLPNFSKTDATIGLTFGTELSIDFFSLALFYRPSVYSFGYNQYYHHIAFDARFDITILRDKASRSRREMPILRNRPH